MIGRVVNEEYRIDAVIGCGGFGTVYQALDLRLQRPVALKMLRRTAANERELRRFLSEGKNLAALNHQNVVQIFRLGEFEDVPFIVMELLEGRPLREVLTPGALPLRSALEILRQVASGLQAIHAQGIVHRDLSTNNILVTVAGAAKILDLGLARSTNDISTVSGDHDLVGTLSYVAPEVLEGGPATCASDLFSFGVIFYEMVAGCHPFIAEHPMAVLYNIVNREPSSISSLRPDVPQVLEDLITRCLDKRPSARPAGMGAIVAALGEILAGSLPEGVGGAAGEAGAVTVRVPRRGPGNPYLSRVMIKRPDDFFGRTQEVNRIFARLNTTPPGSISIVGDRRIGKSSLLNFIYGRRIRETHLEDPERLVMVFLDLQQEKGMSLPGFVRLLRGMVEMELRGRVDVSDCADDLEGIKTMVQRLDRAGLHLAILLDEFEAVTRNPNFDLEFFSFLRFLANHYNVAYLTSSARDLQILCHTKEISDSPFFNIFSTMGLGVLRREDAEQLVRVPSERVGLPLAAYTNDIIDLAGFFPFFLQIACCHALEYLLEAEGHGEPDFDEIGRRFLDEAKLHYRYLWDGFDSLEKSTIVRVARCKRIPDSLQHVLEELSRRNLVNLQDEKSPSLFASSFARFVQEERSDEQPPSLLGRIFNPRRR